MRSASCPVRRATKNPAPSSAASLSRAPAKPGVRTALLATCLTWLQAGRPNDHASVAGITADRTLGVKGGYASRARQGTESCRYGENSGETSSPRKAGRGDRVRHPAVAGDRALIAAGEVALRRADGRRPAQPASLDLRSAPSPIACAPAFCPARRKVADKLDDLRCTRSACPGRGAGNGLCLYRAAAGEPGAARRLSAAANPKSSTGRARRLHPRDRRRGRRLRPDSVWLHRAAVRRDLSADVSSRRAQGLAPIADPFSHRHSGR